MVKLQNQQDPFSLWKIVGTITPLVSGIIMVLNSTGSLRVLEWTAYDFFMRRRPAEPPSQRITIVEVNETDIQKYNWPMTDEVLAQALTNLFEYQPRIVGVDIYRDLAVEPGHSQLQQLYQTKDNLFFIKKVIGDKIPAPALLQQKGQVVTADLPKDKDGKVRRGFLALWDETNNNQSIFSLGTQLAITYLEKDNITLETVDEEQAFYQLGQGFYRPLQPHDGGYVNESIGGYEILINYSNTKFNQTNINNFQTITFDDLVQGRVDPALIYDRIILIGYASPSVGDLIYTPMSVSDETAVFGVEVHANIANQLIESALNGRNNIKTIPNGWEYLSIWGWALLGSTFSVQFIRNKNTAIGGLLLIQGVLVGVYYLIFLGGYWIPVSAPFLAVTSSGLLTIIVLLWLNLKLSYRQLEEYAENLELKVDERTKDLQASQRAILQQEQFLRMVINNIPQQIFWKDRNFRLLGGNSNWAKAMGIQEPEQLLGEVVDQWESDRDQIDLIQTQEQQILLQNQPLMRQERKVELDGQVKWFNESKLPIQDPTGEVVGLLGVVDDVTIYKNAEAAMAIAKQKAEEASQAKSTFIANMSHELRTPLNAIIGFSKIMGRDRNLGEKTHNNLKIINQSGEYLLTLINNILDLSKIEAGKTTFNPQNFDLYNLLDEVENLLKLKAEDKDLYFRIERETSVDQYIHTDAIKLRQVLINLANNAIKFTHEGGVIVRVTASPQASTENLTIQFAIEDTGEGIAEEEIDTIFESFGQSASGRNAQEGTGLGLPISRKFVRMMGGEIEVTSELGVGTTFTFAIQVQRASPEEAQQSMIKPQTIIGLAPDQPTYKLMVVDDIAANRALICQLLEPIGFAIKSASNGQEAVALWPSWQPDLTFMDIKMPGMNGYEATKAIKNFAPQAIVVALTASILEEEKGAIFAAGCDAIINKPFQESDIFDTLTTYLGVSYLYEEQASPSPEEELNQAEFTPALLQTIDPQLLAELSNYAIAGSDDDLIALLQTLGPEHQSLVHHLSLLASQFEFEQIIQLLSSPDSSS